MFSQDQDEKQINVVVKIVDGTELSGKMMCGLSGSIASTLNKEGNFIELQDNDNQVVFVSKGQIATIEPASNSEQGLPKLKVNNLKASNWTEILGVGFQSTSAEVKEAYHSLAKRYHPDLFTIDMPLEVKEYANSMLSRINLAYEHYKTIKQAA